MIKIIRYMTHPMPKRRDSLKMKQGSADTTIRRFAQQNAFNQVWTCGTKEGQRNCEICNQERAKT